MDYPQMEIRRPMDIVFCADRRVLPGLHVAAFSVLDRIEDSRGVPRISVFSDSLTDEDVALLRKTLDGTSKNYRLEIRKIEVGEFSALPPMNGSWAAYYRLQAALEMEVDRFLYLDVDTLCSADISGLFDVDMEGFPAGWVSEAPLPCCADTEVALALGNSAEDQYFNSGVILVNVAVWRSQRISERSMEYLSKHPARFYDQSALNVILHRKGLSLDGTFNCMSNMRRNWPLMTRPSACDKIIHFIDYPKPWDLFAEWVHPQAHLWWAELSRTALSGHRSWHRTSGRRYPNTRQAWRGYRKALKDKLLFKGYENGWLKRVKGVPQ